MFELVETPKVIIQFLVCAIGRCWNYFILRGLRLSELAGLDVIDIDFNQELVKVRGKGKKERIVPVGRTGAGSC